jgi:hypothetical protein
VNLCCISGAFFSLCWIYLLLKTPDLPIYRYIINNAEAENALAIRITVENCDELAILPNPVVVLVLQKTPLLGVYLSRRKGKTIVITPEYYETDFSDVFLINAPPYLCHCALYSTMEETDYLKLGYLIKKIVSDLDVRQKPSHDWPSSS